MQIVARAQRSRDVQRGPGSAWPAGQNCLLLLIIAGLALSPQIAQARNTTAAAVPGWVVDRYTVEAGLPTNLVTGVAQHPDGAIWAATFDGLARIDGDNVESVRRAEASELPGNRFIAIRSSRDGSLWALEEFGGLVRLRAGDGKAWKAVPIPGVNGRFLQTFGAATWLATSGGLMRLDQAGATPWRADVISLEVVALADAGGGALWVGCTGGGLWRVPAEGPATRIVRAPDASTAEFTALAADGAGGVWVGTDGRGLLRSAGEILRQVVAADWISGARPVRELLPGKNGGLGARTDEGWWILGETGWSAEPGMAMPDRPAHMHCGSVDGSRGRWRMGSGGLYLDRTKIADITGNVRAIQQDRDGAIWLASDRGGLVCVREATVTTVAMPPLLDPTVDAVAVGRDGTLWAVNHAGLLLHKQIDGADWAAESLRILGLGPSGEKLPDAKLFWPDWTRHGLVATSLFSGPDGTLWVGTDSGVARWTAEGILPVGFPWRDGTQTLVESMHIDAAGRFWAATPGGLAVASAAEVAAAAGQPAAARQAWRWLPGTMGEPLRSAHTFVESAQGDLFVTTGHQGLARIRVNQVELLTVAQGLSSNRLRGLLQTDAATLWVGTEDAGLCQVQMTPGEALRAARVRCLTRRDGLRDDAVHAIARDAQDRLWLSGNRGISVLRQSDAEAVLDGDASEIMVLLLDRRHGMADAEANGFRCPALALDADGRIFLPTQSGVAVVHPASFEQPKPPPVSIAGVEVQGRLLPRLHGDVTVAPAASLVVRWSAPEFQWPDEVRFRYRLGPAEPWIPGGPLRRARWDGLAAGSHQFEVQAGLGGTWSRSASLRIVRPPLFRETMGFAVLVSLASLLAAAVASLGWVRRQHSHRRRLEAAVEARTTDLRASNQHLHDQGALLAEQARQLAEQAHLLVELDQQKSILLSNVSHELRTPLMLIQAPVANLVQRAAAGDRPMFSMIQRNIDGLRRLVDQLLDTASLQAGGVVAQRSRHDLSAFVRERIALFSQAARAAGITLREVGEPGPIPLPFDADMIDKVLANLLVNALKFTPTGGLIEVSCAVDAGVARVRVLDTGIGIDPALHAKIFVRFYQARSGDDRSHDGVGIGLSLAKELVDLHQGRMGVDSAPGRGSAFWFELPLHPTVAAVSMAQDGDAASGHPTAAAQAITESPPPATAKPRILIVEDHADMRAYLASALAGDFAVELAADGASALALIVAQRPDAVVSDVMMAGMDGLTLCVHLRQDQRFRDLPVVLVSAKGRSHEVQAGLSVARDYLIKPFPVPELVQRLWRLVPQQRPATAPLPCADLDVLVSPPGNLTEADRRFADRLVALIEARMDDAKLSIGDLAHCMAMSPRQFQREVARTSGRRPTELVNFLRLRRAQDWLNSGHFRTVAEVAAAVGLSPRHLRRISHGVNGLRPIRAAQATRS